ncbi:glycosyl hydrolase family 32 [Leifsonia shinshuensis]|uniref:glycosyl hydrolase family 32 n=1 Tax=Leifsonia shinshuensis TaxID=150026 RepID=UPI001F508590|nr:glycosyl hydrolase family 32 [Leifsonia shinshuensis]MCI0156484.1 glycosyl hydrolase family 32 [Leifsonia shinshuensis]
MAFSKDGYWVWDFWLADDGENYHLYYLHAPTSLGDPDLRHRNARIGHAVSDDLVDWDDLGEVLSAGAPGDIDGSATWTGSVVRGDDGLWRMFYTGSLFLSPRDITNVETIGVAVSDDLHTWHKDGRVRLGADPAWYEILPDATWHEEAWRDPWVFRDGSGDGWHMLITARTRGLRSRRDTDRGVIGHARSADLVHWEVQPPLSSPGSGFAHLEVPQAVRIGGRDLLVFSCDSAHLAGDRSGTGGGVWVADASSATGPFDAAGARLLATESLYAGRIVVDRGGLPRFIAFENSVGAGAFQGRITDPYELIIDGAELRLGTLVQEGDLA